MGRNKRQRRAAEELEELGGVASIEPTPLEQVEASEDEEVDAQAPKGTGFAALALAQADHPEDEEEVEEETMVEQRKTSSKKKKKKKKNTTTGAAAIPTTEERGTPDEIVNPKQVGDLSAKKKGKGKKKMDELDAALAELSVKYPDLQQIAQQAAAGSSSDRSLSEKQHALLSVTLASLDSEAEMRKFFGSKVISASKAEEKQPKGARAVLKTLKSNLTKPQAAWWTASQREGLSLHSLDGKEMQQKNTRSGIKLEEKADRWWRVEYSKRYRNVTKAFWEAVLSGDPERFYRIFAKLPWHADTLLQMSEVYRHREEYSTAVDFLNRALFTYERSLIGAFAFTAGHNRLDFDCVENRPFFLAVSRTVSDLQRRGCNRTAFEFAKLLWSLEPYSDPHGATLFLDFLSVRAGMHGWLMDVWDLHEAALKAASGSPRNEFNVTALPGWSYARALAIRADEDAKKEKQHLRSTKALEEAIRNFPCVVPLLADKIDLFLPSDIRGHADFQVHVDASGLSVHDGLLHLLAHLYVFRSSSLWKVPDNAEWLKEATLSTFKVYGSGSKFIEKQERPETFLSNPALARSIHRHVITLTDANAVRRLSAFFPRELLHEPSLSCDPLPPLTAVTRYDENFFADCEDVFAVRPRTRRERELDDRNLARMLPDAIVRQQIRNLYDARPDLQQQFPEGVIQFAQVAAQMGDDFWDEFLPQILDFGGGDQMAPGAIPGQFDDELEEELAVNDVGNDTDDNAHGEEDQEDEVAGDDTGSGSDCGEEDEQAPTFPGWVWQNVVNRFWGGQAAAEREDREHPD